MVQELKDVQLRIKSRLSIDQDEPVSPPIYKQKVELDQNGLVVPKKLFNPCLESRECQELQREIRWNAKA